MTTSATSTPTPAPVPLFLDIETMQQDPYPFVIPDVATMAPPKTYKKPDTIAEWRREKAENLVQELREQSSLEPLLGGIVVVVGVAVGDGDPKAIVAATLDEAGERKLLASIEASMARYPQSPMVTWNGGTFDYAFLGKRALRHGLYGLARAMFRDKPWSRRHVDAFDAWRQHDRQALGRLPLVARYLGVPPQEDPLASGAEVSIALQEGRIEDVRKHCVADVVQLRDVYYRLRAAGWIEGIDALPAELPTMPLRRSERETLLAECAELAVGLDKAAVRAAAQVAQVAWTGPSPEAEGPSLDGASLDALKRFLGALRGGAVDRFRSDVVDGMELVPSPGGAGDHPMDAPAASGHADVTQTEAMNGIAA